MSDGYIIAVIISSLVVLFLVGFAAYKLYKCRKDRGREVDDYVAPRSGDEWEVEMNDNAQLVRNNTYDPVPNT